MSIPTEYAAKLDSLAASLQALHVALGADRNMIAVPGYHVVKVRGKYLLRTSRGEGAASYSLGTTGRAAERSLWTMITSVKMVTGH